MTTKSITINMSEDDGDGNVKVSLDFNPPVEEEEESALCATLNIVLDALNENGTINFKRIVTN